MPGPLDISGTLLNLLSLAEQRRQFDVGQQFREQSFDEGVRQFGVGQQNFETQFEERLSQNRFAREDANRRFGVLEGQDERQETLFSNALEDRQRQLENLVAIDEGVVNQFGFNQSLLGKTMGTSDLIALEEGQKNRAIQRQFANAQGAGRAGRFPLSSPIQVGDQIIPAGTMVSPQDLGLFEYMSGQGGVGNDVMSALNQTSGQQGTSSPFGLDFAPPLTAEDAPEEIQFNQINRRYGGLAPAASMVQKDMSKVHSLNDQQATRFLEAVETSQEFNLLSRLSQQADVSQTPLGHSMNTLLGEFESLYAPNLTPSARTTLLDRIGEIRGAMFEPTADAKRWSVLNAMTTDLSARIGEENDDEDRAKLETQFMNASREMRMLEQKMGGRTTVRESINARGGRSQSTTTTRYEPQNLYQ